MERLLNVITPLHTATKRDFLARMNDDKPVQDRRRSPHETAVADANDHASARLRKATLLKELGYLVTPPNCGLEVGDVVGFTDAHIAGSQVKGRVKSIATVYRRDPSAGSRRGGQPLYEQRIGLGGV